MDFLKTNHITILGKSRKIDVFLFPGKLWGGRRPNKPSRIPGNASKTVIRDMYTCVPAQLVSLHFWWFKSITSPTKMWESKMSIFKVFSVCIFLRQRMARMDESSQGSQWPPEGHAYHFWVGQKRRREKFCSKPNQFRWVVELVSMWIDTYKAIGQYGKSKTKCRMDDCTGLEHFPYNKALGRVGSDICTDRSQFKNATREERRREKKRARLARRRKGEDAKGRPSHIGRAILSQRACLTDNLSQHNIRNTGFTQITSSEIKNRVVSTWCKFEHKFSNPVSTIINAEDLCAYVKRGNIDWKYL